MALDRQRIEKKDFPTARQGYSKAAVDAHLKALADELEAAGTRPHESLATSASDRVRAIVEAAETSAAEIRGEAERRASETRARAESDARAHTDKLSGLTASIVEQLETSKRHLEALIEALPERDKSEDLSSAAAPATPEATSTDADGDQELEGARLIALNMALNGSSRDEAAKYLDEHFELSDPDRLLDDVFASVGP